MNIEEIINSHYNNEATKGMDGLELLRQEQVKEMSSIEASDFRDRNYLWEYLVQESYYSFWTYNPHPDACIIAKRKGNSFVGYNLDSLEEQA